jgi:phenylacetate-coenzyme A ligase PaaK-like adenylate-forming protein
MQLAQQVLQVNATTFNKVALQVYEYQYFKCTIYNKFCNGFGAHPSQVKTLAQIPFLPVSFFKTHKVLSAVEQEQIIFESSGTTGTTPSKHYVADVKLYEDSFNKAFELFFGKVSEYCILALLPAYLERTGSSLVYMADSLIKQSNHPQSGFYLNEFEKLHTTLNELKATKQKTILLGVTFGLLDFIENYRIDFPELIVMETGGMKGRREELTRAQVHDILKEGFGVSDIYSEYGMTELLSQGYSKGNGIFNTPPWMKIVIRDMYYPAGRLNNGQTGGVNIIDLANVHSCSFIATDDIGKVNKDGTFEILGRMDNAEVRGCNLMAV